MEDINGVEMTFESKSDRKQSSVYLDYSINTRIKGKSAICLVQGRERETVGLFIKVHFSLSLCFICLSWYPDQDL